LDQRIYGLETEFAISFEPDEPDQPGAADPPRRKQLYKLFRGLLNRQFALLPALYKKEGDFVENGSLIHYEAQIQHFQDGLIEWATPECSDPLQLLCYSKAQEAVLLESQAACREELRSRGHDGALRFLKNNVDVLGNNYGCHENYLVEDRRHWSLETLKVVCFVLFWIVFLPLYILPRVVFLCFLSLMLVLLTSYFLVHLLARLPWVGWLLRPIVSAADSFLTRHGSRIDESLIQNVALFMEVLYLPFVALYSQLCRLFVFERYRRRLTALLVTRQIYAGCGRLHPTEDGRIFWLSQKAEFVRSVIRVFWNQRYKPIYDIKAYLLEPWTFFCRHKRLHLLIGDSNLSEVSDYLKVAAAGLAIQVIEQSGGASFPMLADPLEAIQRVAGDLELTETYLLTDGRRLSAIEIQRAYLDGVAAHFSGQRVMPIWAREAMSRWREVLDQLAQAPEALHQEIDWMIKRRMMNQLLWGQMDWRELAGWAPALAVLTADGVPQSAPSDSPELQLQELIDRLSKRRRRRLERHLQGLERDRLPEALRLFLALKKIDLKYHEMSEDGYFQVLKKQGLVRVILPEDRIELAKTEPPQTTRARIRGEFIKLAVRRQLTAFAGWGKLKAHNSRRVIRLSDPFETDTESLSVFR